MKNVKEQEIFWEKEYASDYIAKNSNFDKELGLNAWKKMTHAIPVPKSVLECGCNIGRNIESIQALFPDSEKSIIEISPDAYKIVTSKYEFTNKYNGSILTSHFQPNSFELVFSMGVLIHIHPNEVLENMKKMFDYSKKYILIGEYFNRTTVELPYQGQRNKLFKMDYGKLMLENLDVKLIDYGFLWGYIYDPAGFDDITWWLFERQ